MVDTLADTGAAEPTSNLDKIEKAGAAAPAFLI
jgi:hypothetical protein